MCVVTLCFGYIWGSNHYHNMHGIGLAYSICWNTIPPKKSTQNLDVMWDIVNILHCIYIYKLCIYIYIILYIYIIFFKDILSRTSCHQTMLRYSPNIFGDQWIPCWMIGQWLNTMCWWLFKSLFWHDILIGGFKHELYCPFHQLRCIGMSSFPLTNSIIFQDD